jgi:hypothetical protein
LLGFADSGWRADLDFLLRPDKLNRLIEGGYAAPRSRPPPWDGNFTGKKDASGAPFRRRTAMDIAMDELSRVQESKREQ